MMRKILATIFVLGLIFGLSYENGLADGIIIPDPPICDDCPIPLPMSQLSIRYHHVTVTIKDQIASTHVDQVFYNPNDWEVEGDYVFPIPSGASISNFTLWIDGEPVEGEILDAETARKTYEQIVSSMRDPALLEYADQDAVRARIYPIAAKGERRIEIEYSQVLTSENGLVQYLYPLGTEKFSKEPLNSVSVSVKIESGSPIRAVYSPSHKISMARESDYRVLAGYEDMDSLPDQDFSLIYSIGDAEAFHLLSYRDASDINDPDGFFLLLLAPSLDTSVRPIPKDIILVVDQSGSMEGEKFEQAKEAIRFVLSHLHPEDRFNIISFSTSIDLFRQELSTVSEVDDAIAWSNQLTASGSTDINRALLEAASQSKADRAAYLIFLTDGLPTVGEVESEKIIHNFQDFAPDQLSLFVFGVGYDVDTYLLDSLAQNHHGKSTYVVPGEELDETISTFYKEISTPVMTNLRLDFGEFVTKDIYPQPLPDLFQGSQIAVVGRYSQSGIGDVVLNGKINGVSKSLVFKDQEFVERSSFHDEALASIPSLWATRKIGYLLQQIRLHGPNDEVIEEIVKLSIRYGIVTPYTSYLVTEPTMLGAEEQARIVSEEVQKFNDLASMPTFGQGAVEQAEGQNSLASADSAPEALEEAVGKVRTIGSKTFVLSGGIWTDTRFDPNLMKTTKIEFLSENYFSLARTQPHLAKAFALGSQVIVLMGDTAYEIIADNSANSTVPKTTQMNEQLIPLIENQDQPDDETNEFSSSTGSLLPCWGGLIVTMMPMIVASIVKIRRSKDI